MFQMNEARVIHELVSTNAHPIVRRSIERVDRSNPCLEGFLLDTFYDHFLALAWPEYSREPLGEFPTYMSTIPFSF